MRKERSVTPNVLEADCGGKTDRNEHLSEHFFSNNVRGRVLEKGMAREKELLPAWEQRWFSDIQLLW